MFLLISDGVYERISNREIAEQFGCVRGKKGLQECVEKLFAKLASRNSQDNRSIVLVRIKGAGKTVG